MTADAAALRPLPVTDDLDTGGFFEAAAPRRAGHPHVQRLRRRAPRAGRLLPPLRELGQPLAGRSPAPVACTRGPWSTHQVHPAFPAPYTVVLVELDDHPEARLSASWPAGPRSTAGQPMEVWFERLSDDVVLPQWRPAPDQEEPD